MRAETSACTARAQEEAQKTEIKLATQSSNSLRESPTIPQGRHCTAISVPQELAGNTYLRPHPRPAESETLAGWGPAVSV